MKGLLTFCMDLMHCPNVEEDLDKLRTDAKVVKLLKEDMFQPFLNCFTFGVNTFSGRDHNT